MRIVFAKAHTLGELSLSSIVALEYIYGATDKIPQSAIDVQWFQEQMARVGIEVKVSDAPRNT